METNRQWVIVTNRICFWTGDGWTYTPSEAKKYTTGPLAQDTINQMVTSRRWKLGKAYVSYFNA